MGSTQLEAPLDGKEVARNHAQVIAFNEAGAAREAHGGRSEPAARSAGRSHLERRLLLVHRASFGRAAGVLQAYPEFRVTWEGTRVNDARYDETCS